MYVYLRSEPQLWGVSIEIQVDPKNPRVEVVTEDYEGGEPCYEHKGKN